MRAYEIILKKRNGEELSREEIEFFIDGYVKGTIPDYQVSALAMAIYFRGLNARETSDLTMAMVNSGDRIDLSGIRGIKVDKHSSGGVGDKTTIALAPWVAAAGAPVAKMAGRGLGHTGGTIDKLESIPGFSAALNSKEFIDAVNAVGIAVAEQSANLVPADKKLYALRDVTATVESTSLIASSIMSKKIAAGADAIVLDVKVGSGAFMKKLEDAFSLAKAMVNIGKMCVRRTIAVVSSMEQPLGYAVGNALEVREAIDTLKGEGPPDLNELCMVLGSYMLQMAGLVANEEQGKELMQKTLRSGLALRKLGEMISNQRGNPKVIDDPGLLPKAKYVREVTAVSDGYVQKIDAQEIGLAAMHLGAGRERKDDPIDHAAGVVLCKKNRDPVDKGETLAVLHSNHEERLEEVKNRVLRAYTIGEERPGKAKLIYGVVTESETFTGSSRRDFKDFE